MQGFSENLISLIEKAGVDAIFYVPGGAIIHLIAAVKKSKINLIPCYSEQSAVIAAEGYSKIRGPFGVALVTSGPGVTNTATGIASAWIDRTRVLVLAGYVQSHQVKEPKVRSYGPQEFSTKDLFDKITNSNLLVEDESQILDAYRIIDDLKTADVNDGPSVIQICLDKQGSELSKDLIVKLDELRIQNNIVNPEVDQTGLKLFEKEFAGHIDDNSKILLLLGGGCTKSSLSRELAEEISKSNIIPIVVSWQAKDLICHSSLSFVGLPGYFANRAANRAISECDVLISIGCRLDLLQLGFTNEVIKNKVICVDIDPNELAKHSFNSYLPINQNSESVLLIIKETISKRPKSLMCTNHWKDDLRKMYLNSYSEKVTEDFEGGINPYKVVNLLNDFHFDLYIAGSSGGCAEISFLNYYLKKPTRFLNMPGMGSMGFGLPCVGMANSILCNKKVVAVIGDGGFNMNIQELSMLSESKRNQIFIIVLNNNGYDSIRRSQSGYLGDYYDADNKTGLNLPNLERIAEAYSINYIPIKELHELRIFLNKIIDNGVYLIDVFTAENVPSGPKITPVMLDNGSIVSGSLTDLK